MQRGNKVGKQGNKQANIQALDVLCVIPWHIMVLSQYNYARPMRALCAPDEKAEEDSAGARMQRAHELGKQATLRRRSCDAHTSRPIFESKIYKC